MQTGPFEWKEAALGDKVLVEIREESFSVRRKGKTQSACYSEIETVYFHCMNLSPLMHSLHVEAVLKGGKSIKFGASGYGKANGFSAEECRKAVIAFMNRSELASPAGAVFNGVRPSKISNTLFVGIIISAYLFTAYQGWREGAFEDLIAGIGAFGIVAVIMGVLGYFHLRKLRKPDRISAKEVREGLEEV